jgi:heme exporter protein A
MAGGFDGFLRSAARFFMSAIMDEFAGKDLACVRGERLVFEHLAFRIGSGEALALTGPNGSGKSTLLRLMAGLAHPASGEMRWGGTPIAQDPDAHRARVHYVGHLDALKPALSVAENLSFYASLHGARADAARLDHALAEFGLEPLADLSARFLSQGQRRRTALARVLMAPAPLWLLDEPTLGLDDASLRRLINVLTGHIRGGGRLVVATHAMLDLPNQRRLSLGSPA